MKKSSITTIFSVLIITLFLFTYPAFGDDALHVDSYGNVGIKTDEPYKTLHVNGSIGIGLETNYFNFFVNGNDGYLHDGAGDLFIESASDLFFRTWTDSSYNTKMVIQNNGKVGIGDASPDADLEVEKTNNGTTHVMVTNPSTGSSAAACFSMASNGGSSYLFRTGTNYTGWGGNRADDTILLDYGGGDIYFIAYYGGLYYPTGISGTTGRLYNYPTYITSIGGTGTRNVYVDGYGGLGYNSSSIRGKMNVADMEDIDWLYDLRPVNYERKKVARQGIQDHKEYDSYFLEESTGIKEYGLIAEEVALVNPYLVFYDDTDGDGVEEFDEQPAGINESQLITVLLKAIQEHYTELGILRAENKEIKSELCKKDSSYSFCKE